MLRESISTTAKNRIGLNTWTFWLEKKKNQAFHDEKLALLCVAMRLLQSHYFMVTNSDKIQPENEKEASKKLKTSKSFH